MERVRGLQNGISQEVCRNLYVVWLMYVSGFGCWLAALRDYVIFPFPSSHAGWSSLTGHMTLDIRAILQLNTTLLRRTALTELYSSFLVAFLRKKWNSYCIFFHLFITAFDLTRRLQHRETSINTARLRGQKPLKNKSQQQPMLLLFVR